MKQITKMSNLLYKFSKQKSENLLKSSFNIKTIYDQNTSYRDIKNYNFKLYNTLNEISKLIPGIHDVIYALGLNVRFDLQRKSAGGLYQSAKNLMTIDKSCSSVVTHELFHAVDYRMAAELGIKGGIPLTDWLADHENEAYTPYVQRVVFGQMDNDEKTLWTVFKGNMEYYDRQRNMLCPNLEKAYLSRPTELKARVFEKYIADKSGSEKLRIINTTYHIMSANRNIIIGNFEIYPSVSDNEKMAKSVLHMMSFAREIIAEKSRNVSIDSLIQQSEKEHARKQVRREKMRERLAEIDEREKETCNYDRHEQMSDSGKRENHIKRRKKEQIRDEIER